jgi:predicted O-methyltransferase YrrM
MSFVKLYSKWKRSISKRIPGKPPVPKGIDNVGNRKVESDVPFSVEKATLAEIFDDADSLEVVTPPRLIRSHKWAMPEHELIVLGAIARSLQPKLVVEFGTFMGGSTLAMAANIDDDASIITVDIDPASRKNHRHGIGVGLLEFDVGCLFRNTRFASKIEQRFSNTLKFNPAGLIGKADLVFVDADHTYDFVKRDTEMALQLLKPGGAILWHDYTWEPQHPECVGVTKAVNEFREKHGGCRQIAGTRFAIFLPRLAQSSVPVRKAA